jgi:translocation and assembly module TamB
MQDVAASWRILLHAHGNLDGFRLDARSVPDMSQQDVVLLLTMGMTTAEMQQTQASDLGGTAVEALASVSGVGEQVARALPIDELSVTTAYSQRSGRPEPQVTVGKRISDRVRLSASTSLGSENRMMRTGVELQINDQTSVQASYDNVNRESSSSFGNLGVDLRWRLEFE